MTGEKLEVGKKNAFTLVEILIVVVILGILAAIATPQFAAASDDSRMATTETEVKKLRRAIEVYQVRNGNALPNVVAGNGTWGEIVTAGEYLSSAPMNPWVGSANADLIIIRDSADAGYQTTHGWIYDDTDGDVWAGGFDALDNPFPRP